MPPQSEEADFAHEHGGTRRMAREWAEWCFGERKAFLGEENIAKRWIMGQIGATGMTRAIWMESIVGEEVDRAQRLAAIAEKVRR